ncbi:MAG: TerB family tellurite resistance protein [SAR324 cluster bacterium]|nr:TerB family tellurite resistance protein [SAR324 cluster bacterium]
MFTIIHPHELTEPQRNWLAIAICGAIIADGNIAPEEMRYLEQALSFLSSQTKVDALIEAVKTQQLPPLHKFPNGSRQQEVQILLELSLILSSDMELSTREMDFLFQAGLKLGFPRDFIKIIIKWAGEGIVWKRKMEALIQAGSELKACYE